MFVTFATNLVENGVGKNVQSLVKVEVQLAAGSTPHDKSFWLEDILFYMKFNSFILPNLLGTWFKFAKLREN